MLTNHKPNQTKYTYIVANDTSIFQAPLSDHLQLIGIRAQKIATLVYVVSIHTKAFGYISFCAHIRINKKKVKKNE